MRQRHLFYRGTYVTLCRVINILFSASCTVNSAEARQGNSGRGSKRRRARAGRVPDRVKLHVRAREVDSGAKLRQARASHLTRRGSGEKGG